MQHSIIKFSLNVLGFLSITKLLGYFEYVFVISLLNICLFLVAVVTIHTKFLQFVFESVNNLHWVCKLNVIKNMNVSKIVLKELKATW